jgi:CRISPR-associated endonuclease/helicase Cas3
VSGILTRVPFVYRPVADAIGESAAQELLTNILRMIVYAHDFGKMSSRFQDKLRGVSFSSQEIPLTYHVEVGTLLAFMAARNLTEQLEEDLSTELAVTSALVVMNHHFTELAVTSALVVMNHHFRVLEDEVEEVLGEDVLDRVSTILDDISGQLSDSTLREHYVNCIPSGIRNVIVGEMDELVSMEKDNLQDLMDELAEARDSIEGSVDLFLLIQFFYSCLCDMDEYDAKFTIGSTGNHMYPADEKRSALSDALVDEYKEMCVREGIWNLKEIPAEIRELRNMTYDLSNEMASRCQPGRVYVLSAPTGAGKTLALLNFGLKMRSKVETAHGYRPKIIYALPFVSIADQVGEQIAAVLGKKIMTQDPQLTVHHHLAEVKWTPLQMQDTAEQSKKLARVFINLWRSDFVVTSFVKLWNSLLAAKKRELLRLNRIAGSILLLDEVQNIPVKYWDVAAQILSTLTKDYGCTVVLSTATQPKMFPSDEVETISVDLSSTDLSRYRIEFDPEKKTLAEFADTLMNYLEAHPTEDTMVVLNTRKSAYLLFQQVIERGTSLENTDVHFMSGLVTPADRMATLRRVRELLAHTDGSRCVLICTQLIEAGVDISFDTVFRDLGPLDSIIQVAGRCNRHFELEEERPVFVFNLVDENDRSYAALAYRDPVALSVTEESLTSDELKCLVSENQVNDLCNLYYQKIAERKLTSSCLDLVKQICFRRLSEEFSLIESYDNYVTVFIENADSKEVLDRIDNQLSASDGLQEVPPEFYKYSISAPTSQIPDISLMGKYARDDSDPLFYTLDVEKNPGLYDSRSGLRIEV